MRTVNAEQVRRRAIYESTPGDAEAIAREVPSAIAVAPVVRARTQIVAGNKNWVPLYIYGTNPEFLTVRDWPKENILTALLDPDRTVEPRYVAYTATLASDDTALTGLLTSESAGNTRKLIRLLSSLSTR